MMLATSPLLQPMALSTRVRVAIPACDRDRLGSEILHTGTMKLGREWSLPSWHQLSRCFQGKSHLRLKNGLQKNGFYEFWCRFQWRIHWNKSGGSDPRVAWDMAVWSWCRSYVGLMKERVKDWKSLGVVSLQIQVWSWCTVINPSTFTEVGIPNSHLLLILCFRPKLVRKLAILH